MPLDSFYTDGDEGLNIETLVLDQPERPTYASEESYRKLKQGPFYDEKSELWNASVSPSQKVTDKADDLYNELLQVVLEVQYDKGEALHYYQLLQEMNQSYNRGDNDRQWVLSPRVNMRATKLQLMDVLIQTFLFGKKAGRKAYQYLQHSPFFDSNCHKWVCYVHSSTQQPRDIGTYVVETQLWGMLAESQWNSMSVKRSYNALKEDGLYDTENNQWLCHKISDASLGNNRTSCNQLLSILVEASFNRTDALWRYQSLKRSLFYDPKHNQWISNVTPMQEIGNECRFTSAQLLGVMCEHAFEEKDDFRVQRPPLPQIRIF